MSLAAAHESKRTRQVCQSCQERKARFRYQGSVRADRDHTLCFECFRSARERQRAQQLAAVPPAAPLRPLVAGAPKRLLRESEIVHRRAMLAHLELARANVRASQGVITGNASKAFG